MNRKEKAQEIRNFIIQNIGDNPNNIVQLTSSKFFITRQALNRHLKNLISEGLITSEGKTRNIKYVLKAIVEKEFYYKLNPDLQEDIIWKEDVSPLIQNTNLNILRICNYGFTEIFNNVIEHSEAENVLVIVIYNAKEIIIKVIDNGIGIFNKITSAFKLDEPKQAILELSKGKLTTDPQHHTGEGIFFSSRAFDCFYILSGDLFFSHRYLNGDDDDWLIDTKEKQVRGTWVEMSIHLDSNRTIQEVFDKYTSKDGEYGFDKTHIPISLLRFGEESLISRSQAKRLLARFENFKDIVLDFEGVDFIGQAFTDEIFRVFRNSHTDIKLTYIRANNEIKKMIKSVSKSPDNPNSDIINESNQQVESVTTDS